MNPSFLSCLPNCDQSKLSLCSTDPVTSKAIDNTVSGRNPTNAVVATPTTVGFWNCASDSGPFGQPSVITPGYYCYDAASRENDRKQAAAAAAVAALKMWPAGYDFHHHHHAANNITCQNNSVTSSEIYANPFAAAAHHQWPYNPYHQSPPTYERSLHHNAFQV